MTDFYDVVYGSIKLQSSAIPETLRNVEPQDRNIIKGKRLILTGCGDSYAVADYGKWLFRGIRVNTIALSPSELPIVPLTTDDVVIGITASGRSLETIAALEHAQQNDALTVVLTDDKKGKACEYGDHIWETKSGVSTYNTSPSAPTTSAMAYLLQVAVELQAIPHSRMHHDSVRLRSGCENIIDWAEKTGKEISEMLRPRDLVYLVSEGANFAAAQIGMMKFNEYSILKGTAALREEFRHHYNLSISDGEPGILITDSPISNHDRTYRDVMSSTLKMRTFHLYSHEDIHLGSPCGQAIANSIALQMASYHFAIKHDPKKKWFKLPHAEAFKIY